MKKILFLGSTWVTSDLIRIATERGCYTIVTDYLPKERSFGKRLADEYWMLNTGELEALEEKCRKERIDGIFTGVSEFNLDSTLELTRRLGLPCYINPEAWKVARDKKRFKEVCRREGVPVAREYQVLEEDPASFAAVHYPVVVKPVDGNGNIGVSFCKNEKELRAGMEKAKALSKSSNIVIEERLRGREFTFVYLLAEGIPSLFCVTPICKEPGYPTNLYVFCTSFPDQHETYMREIDPGVRRVLTSIGCKEGMAFVQGFWNEEDGFIMTEMGYRMPAVIPWNLYEKVMGVNGYQWMMDTALGIPHKKETLPPYDQEKAVNLFTGNCCMFAGHGGTIAKITGLEALEADSRISLDIAKREGDQIGQYQLLASTCFLAASYKEAEAMYRKVTDTLHILDENGTDLPIRFTNFEDLRQLCKEAGVQ